MQFVLMAVSPVMLQPRGSFRVSMASSIFAEELCKIWPGYITVLRKSWLNISGIRGVMEK